MNRPFFRKAALLLALIPVILYSKTLLDIKHSETTESVKSVYEYTFTLSQNGNRFIMNVDSDLNQGTLNIWLGGAGYEVIGDYTNEGSFTYDNVMFGPLNSTEPVQIRITAFSATGDWHIQFTEFSRDRCIIESIISAILILIISCGFIVWWRRMYRESMKWFWIGGAVWTVGVIIKFVFAFLLNRPILDAITSFSGHAGYLTIGSVYVGSLTGVFEIGITLLFAVLIKSMYRNPCRAIGIGIGAGTVEAILIGFSQIGNIVVLFAGAPYSAEVAAALTQTMILNPVFFLMAPVERAITILCHTSSRILVLFAVARRKYVYFWAGFLLMTGIDAIAGYVHLAGLLDKITMWWIELAILPFALMSIPIVVWCIRHWPKDQ